MKKLKFILLALLLSCIISVISIFVIFKFFLTPERINKYLKSHIEQNINNKLGKSETDYLINDLYTSNATNYKYTGNEFDDIKKLETLMDISRLKDTKIFDSLSDFNFVSSQLSSNINIKMDLFKYKMMMLFSKKNIKEE